MKDRATRIGLNEALFREVNERVRDFSDEREAGATDDALTIVCECGQEECTEELQIAHSAYDRLRADPTLFAIARGHESPEVEEVVERRDAYDVVRKRPGLPREIAEETQ